MTLLHGTAGPKRTILALKMSGFCIHGVAPFSHYSERLPSGNLEVAPPFLYVHPATNSVQKNRLVVHLNIILCY